MGKKYKSYILWGLGAAFLVLGVYQILLDNKIATPLQAISVLLFGIMVFPPANKLILKSPYQRLIRLSIGIALVLSITAQIYIDRQVTPEKKIDAMKQENVEGLLLMAQIYCRDYSKCADLIDQIFNSRITTPYSFDGFRAEDYLYRSTKDGSDCVISTELSSGEKYTRLCNGDNWKDVRFMIDPKGAK